MQLLKLKNTFLGYLTVFKIILLILIMADCKRAYMIWTQTDPGKFAEDTSKGLCCHISYTGKWFESNNQDIKFLCPSIFYFCHSWRAAVHWSEPLGKIQRSPPSREHRQLVAHIWVHQESSVICCLFPVTS